MFRGDEPIGPSLPKCLRQLPRPSRLSTLDRDRTSPQARSETAGRPAWRSIGKPERHGATMRACSNRYVGHFEKFPREIVVSGKKKRSASNRHASEPYPNKYYTSSDDATIRPRILRTHSRAFDDTNARACLVSFLCSMTGSVTRQCRIGELPTPGSPRTSVRDRKAIDESRALR